MAAPARYLRSRPTIAHLLTLLALWLLFFWRYFAPAPNGVVFPDGDFTQQFFIFRDIAYRQLVAGHLPLWANCFFGGYPFHADPQSQLFYLPVWLSFGALRLLGYGHFPLMALTLEAIGHYLAISIFAYFFLRAETGSRMGGLVGAIVLAYGGYLTGYPPLQTGILETVTWLPLALLALRRLAAGRTWRAAAGAAGALSMAFFAGHPQTFLFVAYLSLFYFIFRARENGWGWRRIVVASAGVFLVLGIIASVQLLPQTQFLLLSTRAGLPYDQLAEGMSAGDIAQLFVTQFVSRWHPLYVGIAGLTLAAVAVGLRTGSTALFWLGAAIGGLALALGGSAAGYPLAYWLLPGYRLFRGQERAAVVFAAAVATLAGLGAAALQAAPADRRAHVVAAALRWLRNLTPLAVLALIASVFLAQSGLGDWTHLPPRFGLLLLGLVLAILVLAAFRAEWRGRKLLLVGVVVFELFSANTQTNAAAPFEPYAYTPLLDVMQVDAATGRWFRVQDDARMQGHWACGYGLQEWGGISPIRLRSWANFEEHAPELVRWSLLGIDYVITWKADLITREGVYLPAEVVFEGPAPLGEARVYRLNGDPQRAWLVEDVVTADTDEATWDAIREPGFEPHDTAVVPLAAQVGTVKRSGMVQVLADRPGYLELQVETDAPAFLVFGEAWYPGWQVIDASGRRTPVTVDGFAQGAAIDAPAANIRFEYRPPLLAWGAVLSMVGLLLVVGLARSRRQF
ncbi:MAG: hypothetical protein ACE5FI_04875 [Anaerolineales bacterium]